jgi:hypothetical protein
MKTRSFFCRRRNSQYMSTELGGTNETAARAPALVHVNWREVILFALLAYGLAWAWSGFFLLPYLGDLLAQSTTPTDRQTGSALG